MWFEFRINASGKHTSGCRFGYLGEFIDETGLDLYQMFGDGNIESAAEVDIWKKKFVLSQSLYNPQALSDLGTQMYLLNKWYMQASTSGDFCVGVRIRDEHWFRGDDVMYVDCKISSTMPPDLSGQSYH